MKNTTLDPKTYLNQIRTIFLKNQDNETAVQQAAYLRDQFSFIGLKMPVWREMARDFFKRNGGFLDDRLCSFINLCYQEEFRELQYLGNEMLSRGIKKQKSDFIDCLEEMLVTKSWWDTVDIISKQVGIHFLRYPELQYPTCEKWIESGNIWLQRVAIIHQLHWKEKMDADLMFALILKMADSKEFFIQKGAGWALRSYSRVNAQRTIEFIEQNELPALTKREGLKWLKSKGVV